MEMEQISAGENDMTVELCGNVIEVGITDGDEGMYGQLDREQAELLIAALQAALSEMP